MKKFYFLAIVSLAILIASCKKDAAVKQTIDVGTIVQSLPAVVTQPNGSSLYIETVLPSDTVGAVGNYYMDVTIGAIYGPKTASGWGTAYSFKGAAGAAGSKIYSGFDVPAAALGVVGDYCFDKGNDILYGPKTVSGWGNGTKLLGSVGKQGPPGTANVIYSGWVTPSTYVKDTVFNSYHFDANVFAPTITQAILDQGAVLVYGKLDGYNPVIWPTNQVSPMPILITYMSGTAANIDTWSANVTLGKIQIDLVSSLNVYGSISNAHQFRYVIIPGAVLTAALRQHINLKNYGEVKAAFNLPD